jgi:CDP-diacylglycerol---serine O-phosphatidyltransferase
MKKHLPNFLTCCNLICGTLGIIYIFDLYDWSSVDSSSFTFTFAPAYFVWAACVFDFLDGFAARALKVSSPIGKELDSLADMVSFGLLPSVFMFKLLEQQVRVSNTLPEWLPYLAILIAVFSALRLAIFNVDETQKDSFKGVPTPANTLFVTALPFLYSFSAWMLVAITVLFSFLLVSRIDLFALKFKDFSWKSNKLRFTFLILSVLLIIIFQQASIPLIIILYILLSLTARTFA